MTLEDRIEIQECLTRKMTFKAIGGRLEKDQTTISKEVKRHIQVHTNSFVKREDCCPRLLKAPFVCNGSKAEAAAVVIFHAICTKQKTMLDETPPEQFNIVFKEWTRIAENSYIEPFVKCAQTTELGFRPLYNPTSIDILTVSPKVAIKKLKF